MIRLSLKFPAILLSCMLVACGGGGSDEASDDTGSLSGEPSNSNTPPPSVQQPPSQNPPTQNEPPQNEEQPGVYLLAGSMTEKAFMDGVGNQARFNDIRQIESDQAGNVYVVDSGTVRKISTDGRVLTLAGAQGVYGYQDGTGMDARFGQAIQIAVDSSGLVYVLDGRYIRKVTQAGVVSTIAGSEQPGYEDGPVSSAQFNAPRSIGLDSAGNLYVEDGDWSQIVIRRIAPEGVVSTIYADCADSGYLRCYDMKVDPSGNIYYLRYSVPASAGSARGASGPVAYKVGADGVAVRANIPFGTAALVSVAITDIDSSGNIYYHYRRNEGIPHLCLPNFCWEITKSEYFFMKTTPTGEAVAIEPFTVGDKELPRPVLDREGNPLPTYRYQPNTVDGRGNIYYFSEGFVGKVVARH